MLAPLGVVLLGLAAAPPAQVDTASAAEDPFESLWAPDPDAALPAPPAPEAQPPPAPGAPRLEAPGAPRLGPAPAPPAATVITQTSVQRWYRWPIVISDAAFAALAFVGFGLESAPLVAAGTLGYAFGAPIVHWTNGNRDGGLLSLTMHSLGPLTVGLLGALFGGVANSASCSGTNCGGSDRPWFFAGVGVGVVTTTLTDILLLAVVDEPVGGIAAAPVVRRVGDATVFGLGGRF